MSDKQARRERIAAGLRAHRAMKDVTQAQLADEIDVNQTTLCAWENAGCPSVENAWALADYYGVSLDELVGRKFESA